MRTLSTSEIRQVSGGASGVSADTVGPGVRGLRIPGDGPYHDHFGLFQANLYKRLGAIPRDVAVDVAQTTQMS